MTDRYDLIEVRLGPRQSFYGLLGAPEPPSVRRFSDEALAAAVDKVLASLPADKRAAELEVGADQNGVAAVVAVRLSAGWSIRGGVYYTSGREWGGKVSIRWTGK